MAGSIVLGEFTFTDNTTVRFEIDYGDDLKVLTFRCVNGGVQNAFGRLTAQDVNGVDSTTAVYGQSFPPGTSIIEVSQTPANQAIILTANGHRPGRYGGYGFSAVVPG